MTESTCNYRMERWDHQENRAVPSACTVAGEHSIHMMEDADVLSAA